MSINDTFTECESKCVQANANKKREKHEMCVRVDNVYQIVYECLLCRCVSNWNANAVVGKKVRIDEN